MRLKVFKTMLFALAMMFATITFSASAQTPTQIERPEIYGDIDLTSSELTTVIVQLQEPSIVEAKHMGKAQSKEKLEAKRHMVIEEVESKLNAEIGREYDYLFSGFSLKLQGNQIVSLLNVEGIKAIYPDVHYTTQEIGEPLMVSSPDMFNTAPYVGAVDAWNLGYTGQGITVAVIDTGTDYTHPDLAHAYGDYKGWDFVDDDNDPQEGPGQYHGTHVAGTIAANGLIKGIAPEAKLLTYRVLGPNGGSTSDVVAGIELAVQDGADVMNLSLGNSLNAPDWATSIALDWAMAEGVVAVTSNGNAGPDNWTVGSPGTSRDAISVGATQLPHTVYNINLFTSEGVEYPSSKLMGVDDTSKLFNLTGNTYEFVFVGLGAPEDFEGKDLEGKIALIQRGSYTFTSKSQNAEANGAVGAIIFNNVDEELNATGDFGIPTFQLSLVDGLKMLQEIDNGNNTVTFSASAQDLDETIADFSSRGPAALTWMIKPDVSAPGVDIVSTYPGNSYASLQGTSMASPHVAGAAALLLQAHPDWSVEDVKAALMNTADILIDPTTDEPYPHNTQGAGALRIVEAIHTNTLVTPGSHSYGVFKKDLGMQVERQHFTIKNLSDERKTYTFDVNFEGNPEGINVSVSNNLRVKGNSTQQVNMVVTVDASKLTPGYYEGTITINDGEKDIVLPTILFVGEPDYPRVQLGGIDFFEGELWAYAFLPGGAEYVQVSLYDFDSLTYVGTATYAENLEPGYYEEVWDGIFLDNGQEVQPGIYLIVVFAGGEGQDDMYIEWEYPLIIE